MSPQSIQRERQPGELAGPYRQKHTRLLSRYDVCVIFSNALFHFSFSLFFAPWSLGVKRLLFKNP